MKETIMIHKTPALVLGAVLAIGALGLAGCSPSFESSKPNKSRTQQLEESQQKFEGRTPPDVTGDTEYNNYIKAQELYDDPSSILWCSGSFPTATSPIFTFPIAGKLTSSSVSYYPGQSPHQFSGGAGDWGGVYMAENQSVDGMYHGSPSPYRYGFTPGGQYVDFTNLSVLCTTSLTQFQRENLNIAVDAPADAATDKAEQALKDGDPEGAQEILDGLSG